MNDLSAAWLLHSRPYKERSVIAEFLVENYGRVAMVVRGVRQAKSRTAPLLQPFTRVLVNWRGRSELKTLNVIEPSRALRLTGQSLFCGFYINELVLRSVVPGQFQEGLTELYEWVIGQLQEPVPLESASLELVPLEPVLRQFELELLELTGYLPALDTDARTGFAVENRYYYRLLPEQGLVKLAESMLVKSDCFTGEMLSALYQRDFSRVDQLPGFKRFTRLALLPLIGMKPLRSRELFSKVSTV